MPQRRTRQRRLSAQHPLRRASRDAAAQHNAASAADAGLKSDANRQISATALARNLSRQTLFRRLGPRIRDPRERPRRLMPTRASTMSNNQLPAHRPARALSHGAEPLEPAQGLRGHTAVSLSTHAMSPRRIALFVRGPRAPGRRPRERKRRAIRRRTPRLRRPLSRRALQTRTPGRSTVLARREPAIDARKAARNRPRRSRVARGRGPRRRRLPEQRAILGPPALSTLFDRTGLRPCRAREFSPLPLATPSSRVAAFARLFTRTNPPPLVGSPPPLPPGSHALNSAPINRFAPSSLGCPQAPASASAHRHTSRSNSDLRPRSLSRLNSARPRSSPLSSCRRLTIAERADCAAATNGCASAETARRHWPSAASSRVGCRRLRIDDAARRRNRALETDARSPLAP